MAADGEESGERRSRIGARREVGRDLDRHAVHLVGPGFAPVESGLRQLAPALTICEETREIAMCTRSALRVSAPAALSRRTRSLPLGSSWNRRRRPDEGAGRLRLVGEVP